MEVSAEPEAVPAAPKKPGHGRKKTSGGLAAPAPRTSRAGRGKVLYAYLIGVGLITQQDRLTTPKTPAKFGQASMTTSLSRREFVKSTAAALTISTSSCTASKQWAERKPDAVKVGAASRPNLVFVFPDEFRRQAIGLNGQGPCHHAPPGAVCEGGRGVH